MKNSALVPFTVNELVMIRLTDRGRQYLKDLSQLANSKYPKLSRGIYNIVEDAEGWSEWPMWEVMSLFGEFVFNGQDKPVMILGMVLKSEALASSFGLTGGFIGYNVKGEWVREGITLNQLFEPEKVEGL